MKVACLVLLCVAAASASTYVVKDEPFSQSELTELFHQYKTEHRPAGYKNKREESKRFRIFADNVEFVRSHNLKHRAGKVSFTTGINELSDLSFNEYRRKYLSPMNRTRPQRVRTLSTVAKLTGTDGSVDWRTKGAVTPVKNQGQCGSCWSFSTTGSVEGAYQIAYGELTSLSEQQLMDCSTKEGDHSCQGGLMDFAFKYIEENDGIDSESDYPYKARNEACDKSKEERKIADVANYHDVAQGSETQLEAAVNKGPVSIAIEADQRAFQQYHSGVFDAECGTRLDHGVLAVGYGEESGQQYWIVKNSWGSSWGDQGYIKLVRGRNECGLANSASYPDAKKVGPAPPPSPSPPPPPPSPSSGDYEDPKPNGCHADEQAIQITGIKGDFCSPKCDGQGSACPESGVEAKGQCVLEVSGSSKPTQCALICSPDGETGQCPGTATCKPIQGVGVCTYDD